MKTLRFAPLLLCLAALPLQATPPASDSPQPGTPAAEPAAESMPAAAPEPAPETSPVAAPAEATPAPAPKPVPASMRNGLEIHQQLLDNLSGSGCESAHARWRSHYARAPQRLANPDDELLALLGYVVDEIVKAGLPSEYALIPFIESRYNPSARSGAGPAGMWQFIGSTARNQGITMNGSYDGRYSVIESTRAAVRYLKSLHRMFGENWQLAMMGYNAGEYRILGAIRQSGQSPRNADPGKISSGIPAISRTYVEKLHSISCLMEQAHRQADWRAKLDRPVPRLVATEAGSPVSLQQWAQARALNPAMLARLNPALASGALRADRNAPLLLAPAGHLPAATAAALAKSASTGHLIAAGSAASQLAGHGSKYPRPATHTVKRGDSLWSITRRHGISTAELMRLNGLRPTSTLRPGMVLKLDETRP
ncbi:MAG: transglycosylase SLT domain-containing protein [Pseudomonadota bacterium]|nr:transglycosylase SLT domain-containing protein [Pseudomonadota bacterium]